MGTSHPARFAASVTKPGFRTCVHVEVAAKTGHIRGIPGAAEWFGAGWRSGSKWAQWMGLNENLREKGGKSAVGQA